MAIDYTDCGYSRTLVLLPSVARTATPNGQQLNLENHGEYAGLTLVFDVTAVTATGSLTVSIDAVDAASGKLVNLLTSAAITAVSTTALRIHPNLPVVANLQAQAMLPTTLRVTVTHANAVSMTYTVGGWLALD